jgi:hypothetical protein
VNPDQGCTGGGGALLCAYWSKTVELLMMCVQPHCHGEGPILPFNHFLLFPASHETFYDTIAQERSLDIIRIVRRRSVRTNTLKRSTFCPVCTILGPPDLASSCVDSRPDAKRDPHSYTHGYYKQSLLNTRCNLRKISFGFLPET